MRGIFAEHEHAKFFALISDYRLQWYKELGTPCSTTPADRLCFYHRFKIIRIRLFIFDVSGDRIFETFPCKMFKNYLFKFTGMALESYITGKIRGKIS